MASVKTVSVKYARKVNLGNFSSADAEVSVWVDLEEGDDLNQVMHAMWDMAKANVKMQVVQAMGQKSPDVDLGLILPDIATLQEGADNGRE